MHLLCIFQTEIHSVCDALINTSENFLNKLLVSDAHFWIYEFPCETAIALTFALPDTLIAPMVQLLE